MHTFRLFKTRWLVMLLVLVLAGCQKNLTLPVNQTSQNMGPDGMGSDREQPEQSADGLRYMPYSPASYDRAVGKRRVLFFYANWCSTCTPANKDISEHADLIPEDMVVFRADYDTEVALKKQYGVTYQHTFVQVDDAGKQIAFWNGGGIEELLERIQNNPS